MMYDYDAEIEWLISLGFDDVYQEWFQSADNRQDGTGSRLFSRCGTRNTCGCPTMIRPTIRYPEVNNRFVAQTPALTEAIRAIKGIPSLFEKLRRPWESSDAAGRRKLLEPFAVAQRMTDEVLEKEAANG